MRSEVKAPLPGHLAKLTMIRSAVNVINEHGPALEALLKNPDTNLEMMPGDCANAMHCREMLDALVRARGGRG